MKLLSNGQKIEFKKIYSWYEVYIDNTLILHHLSTADAEELIKVCIKNGASEVNKNANA